MTTDIQNISAVAAPMPGTASAYSRAATSTTARPPATVAAESEPVQTPPIDLKKALEQLVQRAAEAGAELNFRVDDDLGRVIVSVVDPSDGRVLRQMPTEEALRIARALERYEQHLIEMRA